MPTAEFLRSRYDYDAETGHFTSRHTGKRVGFMTEKGYRRIGIDGVCHGEHRLAWLYMTGTVPPECMDHINGVRDDNRWANLRPATMRQNRFNSRKRTAVSPFKGVRRTRQNKRGWEATITIGGRSQWLGSFYSAEEAQAAYMAAARDVAGEFASAG